MTISRSIHVSANDPASFPFVAEYYSIVCMHLIFFIHSSLKINPPSPPPTATGNHHSPFHCRDSALGSTCKRDPAVCVLRQPTYFTQHKALQVHLCCCQWQDPLPFSRLNNILFHAHLHPLMEASYFHPSAVVNNTAVNTGEQTLLQDSEFNWFKRK